MGTCPSFWSAGGLPKHRLNSVDLSEADRRVRVQTVADTAAAMQARYAHDNTVFGTLIDAVPSSPLPTSGNDFGYDLAALGEVFEEVLVPDVLLACVAFLKRRDRLKTKGIFRVPCEYELMLKLRQAVSSQKPPEKCTVEFLEDQKSDPHTVANLLKHFLKEMAEPLIPFRLYPDFLAAAKVEDTKDSAVLEGLISKLDARNRGVFLFILCFLDELFDHEDSTQMTKESLAVLFAPNIMRPKEDTMESLINDAPLKKLAVVNFMKYTSSKLRS